MSSSIEYDKKYWDYQSRIGRIGGMLNLFKFENHISPNDTVLDFGCGGGYLLETINCEKKLGFEINEHALSRARSVGLEVTDDWDCIEDGSVDTIVSNHALEHVMEPLSVLSILYKKLKVGGTMVIVVPCEQFGQEQFSYKANDVNQHVYTWCPQSLGNLIRHAGFRVVMCDTLHHCWTPDFETAYADDNYHDRCVEQARSTGTFQVKAVVRKD